MAEFLLEFYVARSDGVAVERGEKRARIAAEGLMNEGTPIHFLRSIFVPEDETCFYLYEAETVEAVREAARRAGLTFDRVTEAVAGVSSPPQPPPAPFAPHTAPAPHWHRCLREGEDKTMMRTAAMANPFAPHASEKEKE